MEPRAPARALHAYEDVLAEGFDARCPRRRRERQQQLAERQQDERDESGRAGGGGGGSAAEPPGPGSSLRRSPGHANAPSAAHALYALPGRPEEFPELDRIESVWVIHRAPPPVRRVRG